MIPGLDTRLYVLQRDIVKFKAENKKRCEYGLKVDKLVNLEKRLKECSTEINSLADAVTIGNAGYIRNKLDFCESQLCDRVKEYFPLDSFEFKINFEGNRRKSSAQILAKNGNRPFRALLVQNGGFMQQLVSYEFLNAISSLVGKKFKGYDESFSNSDVGKGGRIAEMISSTDVEYVVLIEHKDEIKSQLGACREFRFIRDEIENRCEVKVFDRD